MNTTTENTKQTLARYGRNWFYYLLLGLLLIVLGIIGAIYSSTVTTFAMLWIGILIIVTGILQFIYSFFAKERKNMLINLILSLLAIAAGIFIIAYPVHVSIIFTLIIGCFLIVTGLLRILFSIQMRQYPVWWLILIAGVISFVLGVFILIHWPVSGLWIIGFFISIEVLLTGWSMLITSIAARIQI
jgi:uncharacterized membrane protein HdeD (DUF308 family)